MPVQRKVFRIEEGARLRAETVATAEDAEGALRHHEFSRPVGIIGCFVTFIVGGMTLAFGLPYSAALAGPIFLLVASISMARRKTDA